MRPHREDKPIRALGQIEAELQRRLNSAARGWLNQGDIFIVLPMPMLGCSDGLRLSVQAGPFYASVPEHSWGGYTHVEVVFASRFIPALLPYGAGSTPAGRIYARVPIGTVAKAIASAGGLMPGASNHELQLLDALAGTEDAAARAEAFA